jgi:hypothetical protein
MMSLRTAAPLFAALLLAACSSSTEGEHIVPSEDRLDERQRKEGAEPGVEGAVDVCAGLCARLVACDPDEDEDTCTSKCDNIISVFLSKVTDEFSRELLACIDDAACRDLEAGRAVPACSAEARARVAPSESAIDFCDAYAAAADKCGRSVDKAGCYLEAKIYNDEALSSARKCLSKTCADIDSCVHASLALPGESPAPSPASCTTELSYQAATCDSCMESSCCAEDNACAAEPQCMSFYACAVKCTTSDCVQSCAYAYPRGEKVFDSLLTCMDNRCSASCK